MFKNRKPTIIVITCFLLILSSFFSSCGGKAPAETTPALTFKACEHEPSDWIVDREPTLENTGSAHIECIHCGFVLEFKSSPALSLSQEAIYEKLKPSLVKVVAYFDGNKEDYSQGSGFFIDSKGTFITNAHVVENCTYVTITDYTGKEYEVDLLISYEYKDSIMYNDFAILRASKCTNSHPVEFAMDANPGDTVFTIGFPLGVDNPFIDQGIVIDLSYLNCILTDCYTAPGSSGGILTDDKGRVLGMTSLIIETHDTTYQYTLKNKMFLDALEYDILSAKSPLEYFYPDGIPEQIQ